MRSLLVALLVTLSLPAALEAQESASETLVTGRRSITFNIFSGGTGSFGVWKMRSEAQNLGVLVDAAIQYRHTAVEGDGNDRTAVGFSVGVGPELRRYTSVSGRVAPYGFMGGRLGFGYGRTTIEPDLEDDSWNALLSGRIGLGVDFFPVRNLSIGAQTGVGATLRYAPMDTPFGDADDVAFDIGTFGASLGGAIWF